MANNQRPLACGFHAHSHFSLDGGSSVEKLVGRAKELGRTAMNLTDHGNMNGLADLHMCCNKAGIKAIHGIELYVINELWSPPRDDGKPTFKHLTVHFLTQRAYEWFCAKSVAMEQRAVVIFGERKPILHWNELLEISDEIVLGSGCLGSFVMTAVRAGNLELAERIYQELRSAVRPGRFFCEIFPHKLTEEWQRPKWEKGTRKQIAPGFFKPNDADPECGHAPKDTMRVPNMVLLSFAEKYKDPVVISEDSHLSIDDEWSTQTIKMGRGADSWRFSVPYAMRSVEEWESHLVQQLGESLISHKRIEEFVDNSYQFVSLFDNYKFETSKDRWILPTTELVFGDTYAGLTNKEILKKLIIAGGRMPLKSSSQFQEYVDRLTYEVGVLADNGKLDLLPYFFVLADLVQWARENGRICQSRGSAGGSLVAYLLGITITDPIKWGLQFERFLTLGRILANTLPDIDADFDVKDVVFDRLTKKYGSRLAKISINSLLKVKSSVRDVERVELGEVRDTTEALCRKLPNIDQGLDPIKWLNGYEDADTGAWVPGFLEDKSPEAEMLRNYAAENPKIWETVQKCLGIVRQKSSHACGIILADQDITKYTPMTIVSEELVTGYCPKGCEHKGLVKFDILGVKTLEACRVAINSIKEYTGVVLAWEEMPHDPEVFEYIFDNKLLCGIFQIGTDTMKPFVYSLRPKTTDELSNLVALVRPGTLDAAVKVSETQTLSASDVFVQCSQGKRTPRLIHPDLISILGSTFGILLFQEQALRIFRDIGGFSYEQAEIARRGIGKKDKALLAQELGKLRVNVMKKGTWTEEQVDELCDTIIASARYSFNRCLSGSEKIYRSRGPHQTLSIEEMYRTKHDTIWAKQNKHGDTHKKYKTYGYGKAWSLCDDGKIRKNKIVDIMYAGVREVFELVTESGRKIRATSNHKFPTPHGEKKLEELAVGDFLFVNLGYKKADYALGRRKQGEKGLCSGIEKIQSIKVVGEENVYDVEMDGPNHNFVVSSGIITSNSHSAAYGVVAYNCMWLKYNYPIHFYRGLLSVNNDDHDEIRDILREAGDCILSPDILASHSTEWTIEGNKLRAPLCLIKGVGIVTANDIKTFLETGIENFKKKPPKPEKVSKRKKKNEVAGIFDIGQNVQE